MLHSLLIGMAGGMRALSPLAAVALAANRGGLPQNNGAPTLLGHPIVVAGVVALAAGELLGDKLPSAPDRIIAPGLAARLVTGALAGAALARREQQYTGALLGAAGALAAAFLTFDIRMAAMRRHGQMSTGFVEDALMLGATGWIVADAARRDRSLEPASPLLLPPPAPARGL